MDEFDTFRFVLHVFYVLFTILGNAFTIAVVYVTQQWQTPSGRLIANLALTDFLVGSFLLPFGIPTILAGDWESGRVLCQVNGFTNQCLSSVAILTLAVISFDRYFAIIHSIKYHQIMTLRRTTLVIVTVWSFGILSSILPLAGWGRYVFAPGTSLCVTDFKTNKGFTFFVFMVVFGIPLNAIFFIYIQIFRAVRKQLKSIRLNAVHPSSQETDESSEAKEKRGLLRKFKKEAKAAATMFVIIGVFVLCMTPFTAFNLYCLHTGTKSDLGDFITSRAAYINAVFNPLIYGVMNTVFRRGYHKLFYMMFKCRKPPANVEDFRTTRHSFANK